jgi:hypothetical protein
MALQSTVRSVYQCIGLVQIIHSKARMLSKDTAVHHVLPSLKELDRSDPQTEFAPDSIDNGDRPTASFQSYIRDKINLASLLH